MTDSDIKKLRETHGREIVVMSKEAWEAVLAHVGPGFGKAFLRGSDPDTDPHQISYVNLGGIERSFGGTWLK